MLDCRNSPLASANTFYANANMLTFAIFEMPSQVIPKAIGSPSILMPLYSWLASANPESL